ncbi:Outer membrane protein A [Pandoraea pneumonica]|jgi:OOP family OmpA-OmpF porin|uniref:Outer membrane protein A n=1 Tax=Pandoraea pneumonica TaxID=2508299 RepID=A0A5E4VWX3_9BURK|nr:outer membrane beta-barrel protein [Pandoraea pneumonica]VVE16651.1 Outer membrane protein A [Pandoraea pneumonica]
MKKQTIAALTCLLTTLPALGIAAETPDNSHGFYLGASAGLSNITGSDSDIAIPPLTYTQNRNRFGFKVYAGYQFNDYLALETGFVDLGADKVEFSNGRQNKLTALGGFVDAIVSYPITDAFSVFGKVGYSVLANRSQETGASIGGFNSKDSYDNMGVKGHVTFGAGVKYKVTPHLHLRADYDHFAAGSNGDNVGIKADMFTLGAQYQF